MLIMSLLDVFSGVVGVHNTSRERYKREARERNETDEEERRRSDKANPLFECPPAVELI